MATSLDLQEQEQLDALKAFWKQYGNLVTWVLTLALGAFAAWNAWNWWQREQAFKAGAIFDQLELAAQAADADRVNRIFGDLKERYPRTAHASQGALTAARVLHDKGRLEDAKAPLIWLAAQGHEDEYRTVARLRLAGLLLQEGKHDEALKELEQARAPSFEALVADRRGDVLLAQGKPADARAAYQAAWAAMDAKVEYRRLVEAKLTSLAAPPAASAPGTGAAR